MKSMTTSPKRRTLLGAALLLGLSSLALTGCGGSDDHQSSGGGGIVPPPLTGSYTLSDLSTSGETRSEAFGINSSGQVTGETVAQSSNSSAFTYSGGKVTLLPPPSPYPEDYGIAINALGTVAGVAYGSSGAANAYHAFVSTGGTSTDLGVLSGFAWSFASAINASGDVVGSLAQANGLDSHPFLYSHTTHTMTNLGLPTGIMSGNATGISDSGQIIATGAVSTSPHYTHSFLYNNGSFADLGLLPGYTQTQAAAINASGQITGVALTASGTEHAFLYSGGKLTDLGVPSGFINTEGEAISVNGVIVGEADTSTGTAHAVVYSGGKWTDLNTEVSASGWTFNTARGINDSGQICGVGTFNGHDRAFLLTPKP